MFNFLLGKSKNKKPKRLKPSKFKLDLSANNVDTLTPKKYSAVRIICKSRSACEDVLQHRSAVFLSHEAPSIPLPSCSNKDSCACHYLYLDDRRNDLRRDSDNGLPSRSAQVERRKRTERRKQAC